MQYEVKWTRFMIAVSAPQCPTGNRDIGGYWNEINLVLAPIAFSPGREAGGERNAVMLLQLRAIPCSSGLG
jgi:hypothetical protein